MPGAPGLASETWESKEACAAEFDYTAWCVSMALYSARRPGQAQSGYQGATSGLPTTAHDYQKSAGQRRMSGLRCIQ